MKIKTSELTGAALDWAVAKCEGATDEWHTDKPFFWNGVPCVREAGHDVEYTPTTDWAQGGPLIDREGLGVTQYNNIPDRSENRWQCVKYYGGMRMGNYQPLVMYGPTPLIATMRCYVANKLGDEVEIPEELK